MNLNSEQICQLSESFEKKTPWEIINWAVDVFPSELAMSTSFQTQSLPLLHMVSQIKPELPVLFLDTGFHFWETLIFREQIQMAWNVNLIDLYRDSRWDTFVRQFGRDLPVQDPNLCCYIHKVQPMQQELEKFKAWISGIRRDQTAERAQAQILELQPDGLIKINPMLNWTREEIQAYINQNQLPAHPLLEKGYRSIGCAPCTRAVDKDENERAGRWDGRHKTECGLHTSMFQKKKLSEISNSFILTATENND